MVTVHGEVVGLEDVGAISSIDRVLVDFVGSVLVHLDEHFEIS